jgi:hypothetical protein
VQEEEENKGSDDKPQVSDTGKADDGKSANIAKASDEKWGASSSDPVKHSTDYNSLRATADTDTSVTSAEKSDSSNDEAGTSSASDGDSSSASSAQAATSRLLASTSDTPVESSDDVKPSTDVSEGGPSRSLPTASGGDEKPSSDADADTRDPPSAVQDKVDGSLNSAEGSSTKPTDADNSSGQDVDSGAPTATADVSDREGDGSSSKGQSTDEQVSDASS